MGYASGVGKIGASNQIGRVRVARARYDFATDGGAVGAITLRGDSIPSGAIVLDVALNVTTGLTSGGAATVSLGIEGAADVRAAATLSTAPALDAAAVKRSALLNGSTAPVKTTAARSVVATVATAALTAGAFDVLVQYVVLA